MDPRELVFMSYTSQSTGNANDWRGARCGTSWRPLEIVAMILGFVLFWPIGLAILGFKLWQMKAGHTGDLTSFAQQKAEDFRHSCRAWQPREWTPPTWGSQGGGSGGWRPFAGSTGNHAFDEWRDRKSTRLNSSHIPLSRMPSSA